MPWAAYFEMADEPVFKTYYGDLEVPQRNGIQFNAPDFTAATELDYSIFPDGSGGVAG